MRNFGALLILFLSMTATAFAYDPEPVAPATVDDLITITDPQFARIYFGTLNNFPHTYNLTLNVKTELSLQILEPDIVSSRNNVGVIIIKKNPAGGRVETISRLESKAAPWDTFFSFADGDTFRTGPSLDMVLDPGLYHIEVHTPDNLDKYALVIGRQERFLPNGYFETVRRIIVLKIFFGKSPILVVESPYVYVPLLVFLSLLGTLFYRRQRKSASLVHSGTRV